MLGLFLLSLDMDLKLALRDGYYNAINGNILLKSNPVPIFDAFGIEEGTPYPYIIISDIQAPQRFTDQCKSFEVFITLDIVTASQAPDGRANSWKIGEQVENIINPDNRIDIDILDNNWFIANTYKTSDNDLQSKSGNYYIYRNIRTYRHLISWQTN